MTDKLMALLHEYDTLRNEVVARTTVSFQIGIAVVAIATLVLNMQGKCKRIIVGAIFLFLLGGAYYINARDTGRLAQRLQQIEAQVDSESGGWYVLQWERLHGGYATGYVFKDEVLSVPPRLSTSQASKGP